MKKIKSVLIANRGEIAVRIIKACRELDILSVAVYSKADRNSIHVRLADRAYFIGDSPATESYLNYQRIIQLSKEISVDAVHPGYGFLSENSAFIKAVIDAGIIFIGPHFSSVEMMGSKTAARKLMSENNVPIVPGTVEPIQDLNEAIKLSEEIGYPVMIKASAGGGGKGMRKVNSKEELLDALEKSKSEALKSFGDNAVYIEKYIENPKHIEVQILGDMFGNYIHLFERECSIQRRHQKIIEEAPSPALDEITRKKITEAGVNAARACNYYNAGTIEFLMDEEKKFYFLEMNTRIQVEHPVTEEITGIDIVKEQINIAEGNKLTYNQEEIKILGHALEVRIYAEDPDNNFAPSTGKIIHHRLPSGPGIRIDRGIDLMTDVSVFYDPMLAKLITRGRNRDEAISRMVRALGEYQIAGVITNIHANKWIIEHEEFVNGKMNINFIEKEFLPLIPNKWKDKTYDKYKLVVAGISAVLKFQESKLKPIPIECSANNKWSDRNE